MIIQLHLKGGLPHRCLAITEGQEPREIHNIQSLQLNFDNTGYGRAVFTLLDARSTSRDQPCILVAGGEVITFGTGFVELTAGELREIPKPHWDLCARGIYVGPRDCTELPSVHSEAVPWASSIAVFQHSEGNWWARFTGTDGGFRWLHPTENRWVEEPEQIGMPMFKTGMEAVIAARKSPPPPTWVNSPAGVDAGGGPETKAESD